MLIALTDTIDMNLHGASLWPGAGEITNLGKLGNDMSTITMRILKYIAGTVAVVLCCYLGFLVIRGAYHLVQRLAQSVVGFIREDNFVIPCIFFALLAWAVGRGKSSFFIVVAYLASLVVITLGVITLFVNVNARVLVISGQVPTTEKGVMVLFGAMDRDVWRLIMWLMPLSLDTGICILLILGGLFLGVLTEMAGAARNSSITIGAVAKELCLMNATMNAMNNTVAVKIVSELAATAKELTVLAAIMADHDIDDDLADAPTGSPEKGDATSECKQ